LQKVGPTFFQLRLPPDTIPILTGEGEHMDEVSHSTQLQLLLDRLNQGHDEVRELLVENSLERFRHLTRKMFPRTSALRRLDETDDVLQKAMVRLHRALTQIHPPDVRAYVGLAARQIRWVLSDLAREAASGPPVEYTGERVPGPTARQEGPWDVAGEPSSTAEWAEFHGAIERLPDEAREVFDLLLYEGMTQPEAAEVLGIPLRTFKRRWQQARLLLRDSVRGEWPTLEGEMP
jgi:RNA polymerase sigma-70 factor (ECF subfamily)